MGVPEVKRQGWCKACETLGSIEDMEPVKPTDNGTADLGDILSDRWLCRNETACLVRYAARSKGGQHIFIVILPAEEWASGGAILYTRNPRRAHRHAAYHGACVVRRPVEADYRKV
jgi:hypothetical protein